ncbi:MAG: RelA/SpoT family protein [Mariprofundaceae bacterium]
MSRIYEITEKVLAYFPKADIELINRAYVFAAQAHVNQTRRSGEPYLEHPLAVANILASLRLDEASIVTGLLHDTVEDTTVTLEDVQEHFGDNIANLVDGITKIAKIKFRSSEHKQAENFRKMILATAKDLRVLLVKLADRLHNMRTLVFLPKRKRRGIALETMQIYAPLAHRLGIHWLKQELEDLAFIHLDPEAHQDLSKRLSDHLEFLNSTRERLEKLLQEALDRHGISAEVHGRMKHMYSLHQKLERKHVGFDDIYDLVAFRVIVQDMPACYHVLGIIHSMYRPVPGRFKDYIALPKPNGYQSLHTSVIGPENYRIEVQIRTEAMHHYAEDGIAAHWAYKGADVSPEDKDQFRWLSQLTDLLQESDQPGEFLENVRLDLFVQEVYVFTRDGDIMALPRGATPLDFAYAIHTNVGNRCVGVRINGESVDFDKSLRNGDQVEVLTDPEQTPSQTWLQHVHTPRARQSIRQWFRRQKREASIRLGGQILDEVMGRAAKDLSEKELSRLHCKDMNTLRQRLGEADINIEKVLKATNQDVSQPLMLKGLSLAVMQASDCCCPLPGDPILGYLNRGQGMHIHHRDCPTIRKEKKKLLFEVKWEGEEDKFYSTKIIVRTEDRRGMLTTVSGCISRAGANIEDLTLRQLAGSITTLHIRLEVSNRIHLARILRVLHSLDGVVKVSREMPGGDAGQSRTRSFTEMVRAIVPSLTRH